jgi:hypothetical protein
MRNRSARQRAESLIGVSDAAGGDDTPGIPNAARQMDDVLVAEHCLRLDVQDQRRQFYAAVTRTINAVVLMRGQPVHGLREYPPE